jgi:hypothetical protein
MSAIDKPGPDLLQQATYSARWAALARGRVDPGTLGTWDRTLPRTERILVPVDVQAFVSAAANPEPVVPVSGTKNEPVPFDGGAALSAGVHLHWAMPDALLRGQHDEATSNIALPALPDRWVVIRTVLPTTWHTAHVKGWILDAVSGQVLPLETFSGTVPDGGLKFDRLDGAAGGTLLWSATYAGAVNRFAVHDPLDDLPALIDATKGKLYGGRAVYTVAGWWSDPASDPLAGALGPAMLDDRLTGLGWYVNPDAAPDTTPVPDPRVARLQEGMGMRSPAEVPPVTTYSKAGTTHDTYTATAQYAGLPLDDVRDVFVGPALPSYHCLLHGSVLGVPIDGSTGGADDRPDNATLGAAMGLDVDDVAAAFAEPGLGLGADQRLTAERLVAAFTGDLLSRLGSPDGLADLADREHDEPFWSFVGAPLPNARADRLRADDSVPLGPTRVGRKGRASAAGQATSYLETRIVSGAKVYSRGGVLPLTAAKQAAEGPVGDTEAHVTATGQGQPPPAPGASREVTRPAPRMFRPAPAILGLRGAKPNARHHGDGLFDDSGRLRCRYPGEVVPGLDGVVSGAAVVPTLGSGAIPDEVLPVVREAVVLDPYSTGWLAGNGSTSTAPREMLLTRLNGEAVRLYGTTGTYDGSGVGMALEHLSAAGPRVAATGWPGRTSQDKFLAGQVAAELSRFAVVAGTTPSPVALTPWRQPWVPLWVEWQVRLDGTDQMTGWDLVDLDVTRTPDAPPGTVSRTVAGRSPLTTGVGTTLTEGIKRWLADEGQRDLTVPSTSQLSEADEATLGALADLLVPLDVTSASLDGVGENLLGIDYVGQIVRTVGADGKTYPTASGIPVPLFGGTMTIEQVRLVDAFGRTVDVPVGTVPTASRLEVAGQPATMIQPARLQHGGRWLFRLVDPGYSLSADPLAAPEAYVDQVAPSIAVNPVSGFLLPDHIDEALEVFDVSGNPLGQLSHDPISNAVQWEPAPGRPLPPDAGPLADTRPAAQHAALFAAGVVRADVAGRHADSPPESSALTALLRAVDTTLWAVDTFAALGSPSVAGLVGRPIAVVRATMRLDAPDDVEEVDVTNPGGPDGRRAAFAAGLAGRRFPVRLGDLARSDDSLLGFFVDDDYAHLHVVDKAVAAVALDTGRHRGQLGLLGKVAVPSTEPLDHPYLALEDTLWVEAGQVVRLTLLMLPAGKVHLTSGILPRKALALADDWVTPGLQTMVPSVRVGPVLVDPAEIRLPKVASLGKDQVFTRRTGPLTWRDDPILAASQAALLPRLPHEAQEGYVRVAPAPALPEGTP